MAQILGFSRNDWNEFNPQIGANWFPSTTTQVVDYPASLWPGSGLNTPTAGQSIKTGQANLDAAIREAAKTGQHVNITGLSQGAIIADAEQIALLNDPDAPPADQLTFVVIGDPSRGVANLVPPGVTVPVLGWKVTTPTTESQYDTDIIYGQYDGWADFPDRPWNLIADANAIIGGDTVHTPTALAHKSDAVVVDTTTNSKGATTTTYMVPTRQLPLTQPLRDIGAPTKTIDKIDKVLRPVVNAGYSRLTPNAGPHIQNGILVAGNRQRIRQQSQPGQQLKERVDRGPLRGPLGQLQRRDRASARHPQENQKVSRQGSGHPHQPDSIDRRLPAQSPRSLARSFSPA